jgi:glycosyltransferase involved in cell wall biosynthesis
MPDPWREVDEAGQWLLGLAAELRPDLVHLNGYVHAALPWKAPVVVVGHSCVLSWWEAVRGTPAPPEQDEYRRRVAAGLRRATAVVAPTRAMLAALQRHYGVRGGTVVPNCRRPDALQPLPEEPLVLGAGRVWDEAKNLHVLASLAPCLSWDVRVAGDAGGETGEAFLGPLPWHELSTWMGRAALFAAPSSYEPFGLAPLEAALAGCALVLGELPSLREVWGDAAVFVDGRDPEALAAAVERLAADDDLRHELATQARRRALELSPERTARGYLDVYGRVAQGLVA